MKTTKTEFERICEAYLTMAKDGNYRPSAPSDGFGHIQLTKRQIEEDKRLREGAHRYAKRFVAEWSGDGWYIGISNWESSRALALTIEAARLMCGAAEPVALRMLKLAVMELERVVEDEKRRGWR